MLSGCKSTKTPYLKTDPLSTDSLHYQYEEPDPSWMSPPSKPLTPEDFQITQPNSSDILILITENNKLWQRDIDKLNSLQLYTRTLIKELNKRRETPKQEIESSFVVNNYK